MSEALNLIEETEAGLGTTGDPVVDEAKRRYQQCAEWEAPSRERFIEDLKFSYGDSDNGYQWPSAIRRSRDVDSKPCLTMNILRQHNLQIINDAKRNKSEVTVQPTGGGATYESAQVFRDLLSDIQYNSQAQLAYSIAREFQVYGGIGWWRLVTRYADEDSFDQEIVIQPVKDPLSVYLDPDIRQRNGSDARFGLVFDDVPRDEFREAYPEFASAVGMTPLGIGASDDDWVNRDHIRVCEYFRKIPIEDWLLSFIDPSDGTRKNVRESDLPAEIRSRVRADSATRRRKVWDHKIEWYLIAGDQVIDHTTWPGKYIPLIRCIGEEQVVEGILDRKGHSRSMKDAQRMFNYNSLSLSVKVPTPNGWTTMGEIRKGDWVFDHRGHPVQVKNALPVEEKECRRVTFDTGYSVVASTDHQWRVEERVGRKAAGWVWETKTVHTEELEPRKHFILCPGELALPEANLPVDPYVLGLWIGDGKGREIEVEDGDEEESASLVREAGFTVSVDYRRILLHGFAEVDKMIPESYLRASRQQRLSLLQGLMDADGHFAPAVNQCVYVKWDKQVVAGVLELCASLGIKTTVDTIPESAQMLANGGVSYRGYRVQFTADPDVPVFRLRRKAGLQTAGRATHWRRTKRIGVKFVESVENAPVRCIEVDSPEHLFLCGDGMIPTHNCSAQVEHVALQTKTPWMGAAASIDEFQQYWNQANTNNNAFMPFNHVDDDGNPIPPEALPRRIDPPVPSQAFEAGMQTAFNQMMMVSGQWQNQMGMMGNERTGSAIQERMDQGDVATYHFRDNYESALVYTGMQIIDLIPRVYDTRRILMVQADDGSMFELEVDPRQREAFQAKRDRDGNIVRRIFNPSVGRYEVRAAPGQSFGTRREETVQALTLILTQAPALTGVIGDLLLSAMDFKEAQEAAQRLKRMVPPQALGQGPSPNEQQLMQHNLALTNALRESLQKLGKEQLKITGKDQMRDIDAYKAETDRFKALSDVLMLDQGGIKQVIDQLVSEAAETHLTPILKANKESIEGTSGSGEPKTGESAGAAAGEPPPIPGAAKAPDGEWYLQDPTRQGKYLRVSPLAQERQPRNIISNA